MGSLFYPCQRCGEVWLPRLSPIVRKRLLKVVRIGSDLGPHNANENAPSIEWFLIVKLATPILELTNRGLGYGAVIALGKILAPLM